MRVSALKRTRETASGRAYEVMAVWKSGGVVRWGGGGGRGGGWKRE